MLEIKLERFHMSDAELWLKAAPMIVGVVPITFKAVLGAVKIIAIHRKDRKMQRLIERIRRWFFK